MGFASESALVGIGRVFGLLREFKLLIVKRSFKSTISVAHLVINVALYAINFFCGN